ncbi:hypothetical protein T492DRAFT_843994 [Pavlovales sp. CCMP2436]|nr:hypothetical protein T492DRAFT_843994 [Pavlovales sp. CCMP2436]
MADPLTTAKEEPASADPLATANELRAVGSQAFAAREYAAAVRAFSRALALDPGDAATHAATLCNRSAALLGAGSASDALRDAEAAERTALRTGGGAAAPIVKPLYRQAQALAALELWEAVTAVCVRALSTSPGHGQLLALLRSAVAAGAEISGEAAAEALAGAIAGGGEGGALRTVPRALSAAAASAGELDDSLSPNTGGADTEIAVSGAAYVADCRSRGNEAFSKREYGQATAWYTHGLREAPEDAVLLSNRAAARLALGQLRDAAADSADAVALQPRYLRGALRAAVCHLRIGEYDAAREYCLQY